MDKPSSRRVLPELAIHLKFFKFIELKFQFVKFQLIKFQFKFLELTKPVRAAICVLLLYFLLFAFVTIIFLLLLLLLLFLFLLIIFIIVIFFLVLVLTKHQQLRATTFLVRVEPELKSKLRNARMEFTAKLSAIQYGMSHNCVFNVRIVLLIFISPANGHNYVHNFHNRNWGVFNRDRIYYNNNRGSNNNNGRGNHHN